MRKRLFTITLIFLISTPIIFNIFLFTMGQKLYIDPVYKRVESSLDSSKRLLEQKFEYFEQQILTSVESDFIKNMEKNRSEEYFFSICRNFVDISAAYAGYEDGTLFLATKDGPLSIDIDPRERPWYIQAKKTGQTIISDFYTDAITGDLTVTIATPIYKDCKLIGVLGYDIYLKSFISIIKQIFSSSLYKIVIYDQHYTILYSEDKKQIGKRINLDFVNKEIVELPELIKGEKKIFKKYYTKQVTSKKLNLVFLSYIDVSKLR